MAISLFVLRVKQKIEQYWNIVKVRLCRHPKGLISPLKGVNTTYSSEYNVDIKIRIFGKEVPFEDINWHKDYKSGYIYPRKRFDRIKYTRIFNQGIEVKFPWNLSRFQFGVNLALGYHKNKEEKQYHLFKALILNWIKNNPFLFGINWVCKMDIAIRAANWIVAVNMFGAIFWKDKAFVKTISKSLIDHAYYLATFLKIQKNEQNNNHLIADCSGLFVVALSLEDHPCAAKWAQMALNGLEMCMKEQVLIDGVDFEHSIPYHRLVLELLAIPLLLKDNCFSTFYKQHLFKMVEFVHAYIDHKGNAPQIGDNDSGIFIKLSEREEQNHAYLLSLGESIFGYDFGWKENNGFIPVFRRLTQTIGYRKVIDCSKSICFKESGFYFLKNKTIAVSVFCPPPTNRGHRHFDTGSFTLSFRGNPIIVDPGTGCYTSDLAIRKQLRDYSSHNLYYTTQENRHNFRYFGVCVDTFALVNDFSDNDLYYTITLNQGTTIKRHFHLRQDSLVIEDDIKGHCEDIACALHFYHTTEVLIEGAILISEAQYLYSPMYSVLENRKKIIIQPSHRVTTQIVCR